MKKKIVFLLMVSLIVAIASPLFAQDFTLPKIENNKKSVETAYRKFIIAVTKIGFVDIPFDSVYPTEEEIIARHIKHLDGVLTQMSYGNVKKYINELDAAITAIDYQELTKKQVAKFNNFLANPVPQKKTGYSDFGMPIKSSISDWEKIKNFEVWKLFFKKQNKMPLVFFNSNQMKKNLYRIADEEIPQKLSSSYKERFDRFWAEWESVE